MAVQKLTHEGPSHDATQQDMMADIDRVSKMELSVETLQELQTLFRDVFLRPVVPIQTEICPICQEPFQGQDGTDAQPVTVALGCSSNHFVHLRCERTWLRS